MISINANYLGTSKFKSFITCWFVFFLVKIILRSTPYIFHINKDEKQIFFKAISDSDEMRIAHSFRHYPKSHAWNRRVIFWGVGTGLGDSEHNAILFWLDAAFCGQSRSWRSIGLKWYLKTTISNFCVRSRSTVRVVVAFSNYGNRSRPCTGLRTEITYNGPEDNSRFRLGAFGQK